MYIGLYFSIYVKIIKLTEYYSLICRFNRQHLGLARMFLGMTANLKKVISNRQLKN